MTFRNLTFVNSWHPCNKCNSTGSINKYAREIHKRQGAFWRTPTREVHVGVHIRSLSGVPMNVDSIHTERCENVGIIGRDVDVGCEVCDRVLAVLCVCGARVWCRNWVCGWTLKRRLDWVPTRPVMDRLRPHAKRVVWVRWTIPAYGNDECPQKRPIEWKPSQICVSVNLMKKCQGTTLIAYLCSV